MGHACQYLDEQKLHDLSRQSSLTLTLRISLTMSSFRIDSLRSLKFSKIYRNISYCPRSSSTVYQQGYSDADNFFLVINSVHFKIYSKFNTFKFTQSNVLNRCQVLYSSVSKNGPGWIMRTSHKFLSNAKCMLKRLSITGGTVCVQSACMFWLVFHLVTIRT